MLPADDADDLTWLLFRQQDVITFRQALRFFTEAAIRHRLRSGRWSEPHPRVFVAHGGAPVTDAQRLWIAALAAGPGALVAGCTAIGQYGLRRYSGPAVHLLLPARRQARRLPPGVVAHRTTVLPADDVHARALPPRTMPARTVVDAAQWAPSEEVATAIVAAAFQRGLVTEHEISEVLSRLPRARRRSVIAHAAADAAGGSHSLAELHYLRRSRQQGLPEPSRQVFRVDASGRRRYLDIYYEQWRVHVEIDGAQHNDPRAAWADMQRQNDLWIPGERLLRFPAFAVRHHPTEVFAQVRAALLERGWVP